MRAHRSSVVFLAWALSAMVADSSEGRIPVFEPGTITQPGRYMLVRNVGVFNTASQIIIAANDVDLDLNGFTLAGTIPLRATNVRGVTVHGGSIQAAEQAIMMFNVSDLALRRLVVESWDDCAVTLSTIDRGVVSEMRILSHETGALCVTGSTAVAIEGNQTSAHSFNVECAGCRIAENLAGGGMFVSGSANLVEGNVCRGAPFADGLRIAGSWNQVVGNLLVGNGGIGLRFEDSAAGNVFRGNTARGNAGGWASTCPPGNTDFCDLGLGNSSLGDNFLPGLQ